jgi:hypothetical protein
MIDNEIISYFLTELGDKVQSEINAFSELSYDERLQLAYSSIDRIIEHVNHILEKIAKEDRRELLEFLARQNNEFLAIKFAHILPIQEIIALYFANGTLKANIMQYYAEAINDLLDR